MLCSFLDDPRIPGEFKEVVKAGQRVSEGSYRDFAWRKQAE
jgi:hypothetical protein